jgi:hypothetical protein
MTNRDWEERERDRRERVKEGTKKNSVSKRLH